MATENLAIVFTHNWYPHWKENSDVYHCHVWSLDDIRFLAPEIGLFKVMGQSLNSIAILGETSPISVDFWPNPRSIFHETPALYMLRVKSVKSPKISWCPKGIPDVSTTSLALFHASIPIDSPYSSIKNVQNHPKESINVYHPSSLDDSPLLSPIFSTLFPSLSPWNFAPRRRTSRWAPRCARPRGRPGSGRSDGPAPAGGGWGMGDVQQNPGGFRWPYYDLLWSRVVLTCFDMVFHVVLRWFEYGFNML